MLYKLHDVGGGSESKVIFIQHDVRIIGISLSYETSINPLIRKGI